VEGQTAEEYEENLMANLQSLVDRAKSGTYMAPPLRRVHTLKAARLARPVLWGFPNGSTVALLTKGP
jgi:hypothetical protein